MHPHVTRIRERRQQRLEVPAMIVIGASTMFVITQDFGTTVVIGFSAVLVLLLDGDPEGSIFTVVNRG